MSTAVRSERGRRAENVTAESAARKAIGASAGTVDVVPTETLTACPNCDGPRLRRWCVARDRSHESSTQQFTYSRCRDCRLIFQSERPIAAEIAHFYPTDYGPYGGRWDAAAAPPTPLFERIAEKLASRATWPLRACLPKNRFDERYAVQYECPREGAKLLDFGCGTDRFLNRARKLGWTTTGVDFSPASVESARASGHEAHLVDDALWDRLPDESFAMIRLSHVLEHLYDPRTVMSRLLQKLEPGGRLHMALPNPRSIANRIFRSRWFALEAPRHIMLFEPANLRTLLEEVGYRDVAFLHESAPKDVARSWAYLLRDWGLIEFSQVHGYIYRKNLTAAIEGPSRIFAAWGCGDRFHTYARK